MVSSNGQASFAAVIKNTSGKTMTTVSITLGDEEPYTVDAHIEPGKTASLVLGQDRLTKNYISGNTYRVIVAATFDDGSTSSRATTVTCMGTGGSGPRSIHGEGERTGILVIYVYGAGTTIGVEGIIVKVDGNVYVSAQSGEIKVHVSKGDHTIEIVAQQYLAPYTRFIFTGWSDGSTDASRTISVLDKVNLTAYVTLQHKLSVNIYPAGWGLVTVSPFSSDWFYDAGATVVLTATPLQDCAFDSWTGDALGSDISKVITMDAPKNVTANFFSFNIYVTPTSGIVSAGGNIMATVTITRQGGVTPVEVGLSVLDLPSDVSVTFNPPSIVVDPNTPSASSVMNIAASMSAPSQSRKITIAGAARGLETRTHFSLVVAGQGGPLLQLQGHSFCFGFSGALSDYWIDESTGATYPIEFRYYLLHEALGAPTGSAQQDDAVIIIWGHSFIYGWSQEPFTYRPSSTETVGEKSSANIFQSLQPPDEDF
ncbi:MAG: hypothetical protein QXG35_02440 [Nitrososphaerota archaeon]